MLVLRQTQPTPSPPRARRNEAECKGCKYITDKGQKKACSECKTLSKVLKAASQKSLPEKLGLAPELRIGKFYCDKDDAADDVCTRIGVLGDGPDAAGVPALLWFRNGTYQGAYPSEPGLRTAEAIKAWAKETAAPPTAA